MLLDLRGRIFRHAQALSVDFHERYTSGRLISRSTTDVESLRELLNEGLQELVTVVLSFVYIAALLLWLDSAWARSRSCRSCRCTCWCGSTSGAPGGCSAAAPPRSPR